MKSSSTHRGGPAADAAAAGGGGGACWCCCCGGCGGGCWEEDAWEADSEVEEEKGEAEVTDVSCGGIMVC